MKKYISEYQQEIKSRQEKAERFDKRKSSIDKWQQQYDKYQEYQRLHTKLQSSLNSMNICERALKCSFQLNQLVTDVESSAMQSFLEQLNEECATHMQAMFGDDLTLRVTYQNDATNDGEEKKYYVDVELYRDGEGITYDSLSGGESDRCALVLFLAFNRLSHGRMLLLDECLSSLHAESVEDIVAHIKDHFQDKLCIMTLHQTTKGIFDQVIDLNEQQ